MKFLLSLLPLLVLLVLFAILLKVSARIVRRTRLSWRHSFVFALAVVLIGVILRTLIEASDVTVPVAVGVLLAFSAYIGFGTWYLSRRASTRSGEALGYGGAALLSSLACTLLGTLALLVVNLGNAAQ